MKKKFTHGLGSILSRSIALLVALAFMNSYVVAQTQPCTNSVTLWQEDFGTGNDTTSHPDALFSYEPTGPLFAEGSYRVASNLQQKIEWHNSPDHTGNTDGRMLVVNGDFGDFFMHTITSQNAFSSGAYYFRFYIINANVPYACFGNPLLASVNLYAEYLDGNNNWVAMQNSPNVGSPVPTSNNPVWIQQGGTFILPPNVVTNNIRIRLSDATSGGCGNDFAVDDFGLFYCPDGGPLPVNFLDISAIQKSAGILVQWKTAFELNNKYFNIEKSTDGVNWTVIGRVESQGNSQFVQTYQFYDRSPVAGNNIYRVRQYDIDNRSTLSRITSVKVTINGTSATVVNNPFINHINIDFLSKNSMPVEVALYDMAGKQVAIEKWNVVSGSSRMTFTKAANAGRGMYIMTIKGANNEVIFNGKVVKQ